MCALNTGDVGLSVAMSVFSNILAACWIPLNIILFYDFRFNSIEGASIKDYWTLFEPIVVFVGFIVVGLLIKIQCTGEQGLFGNSWPLATAVINAKIAFIIANTYIIWALLATLDEFCYDMSDNLDLCRLTANMPSFVFIMLMMQPVGFLLGWGISAVAKEGLKSCDFRNKKQSFDAILMLA
jgi:predicted Na+-dependent transporter